MWVMKRANLLLQVTVMSDQSFSPVDVY